jgi:aminomuconate-semialdehyde/2-hydroxymuconate-6-semialdehyde dehydrogenase
MTTNIEHLIGSEWRAASDGATFDSRDPHDGAHLAVVAKGTSEDGKAAITAARSAFDDGPWPTMSPKERAKILHDVADAVDAHRAELADLETRDGGKTITQSLHAEIPRVAHNLRFFADYAAMTENEAYPDGDLLSYTLYPPAGVVSAISPWNAPLMLATWKIAPALAFRRGSSTSCTVSEENPSQGR